MNSFFFLQKQFKNKECLNNLGAIHLARGRLNRAAQQFEDCLKILLAFGPEEDSHVAMAYYNLGLVDFFLLFSNGKKNIYLNNIIATKWKFWKITNDDCRKFGNQGVGRDEVFKSRRKIFWFFCQFFCQTCLGFRVRWGFQTPF